MSLKLRLFLGLSCLVAVMVVAQWWWVRQLTRDLTDEVSSVAFEVSHSLASLFSHAPQPCAETECEEKVHEEVILRSDPPVTVMAFERKESSSHTAGAGTERWIGVREGEHPLHWAQIDDDTSAVHWIGPRDDGAVRKVKIARKLGGADEETHDILLRLETAVTRLDEERAADEDAPSGSARSEEGRSGEKNSWFGTSWFSSDNRPTRAYLTVIDTGDNDLSRIPIPQSGLHQKLEDFRRRMLWGSFGIFAVGLLLSAVVAQRVSAPLQRLARAAHEVGEGALGKQVTVTASGEVGQAIHAFNRMSSELEDLDRKTRQLRAREHLGEIGEIARGLAHTLRNPLNALGLSVEELAAQAPGEATALATAARRQIRRIDQSIRSFLALASQGGGVVSEVELSELVQDVALEALQDSRGRVKLAVDAQAGESGIAAVEPELRAVLQALLVNAVEASPEGGTVAIRVEPKGAGKIRVEIEDEGPGLPGEVKNRLFTPHLTTKANGSGMGLFLAHRIATNRYGGRLELREREGGGTRAVLDLGPRTQEPYRARTEEPHHG